MVGHDVGVPASLQDEDFLLKCGNVVICEEGQKRKTAAGREFRGNPSVPGDGRGGVGKKLLGPLSPGSIFTIFNATRSPVTLSRALEREVDSQTGSVPLNSTSASLSQCQGMGPSLIPFPSWISPHRSLVEG